MTFWDKVLVNMLAVQTGAMKKRHSIVGTKMTNREVDGKFQAVLQMHQTGGGIPGVQYRGNPCR